MSEPDPTSRYEVATADVADAEREQIFVSLLSENPEYAKKWLRRLNA